MVVLSDRNATLHRRPSAVHRLYVVSAFPSLWNYTATMHRLAEIFRCLSDVCPDVRLSTHSLIALRTFYEGLLQLP